MPRAMAAVESMTPDTGRALGDRFTTADVVFGGALAFFSDFNMMDPSPKVTAYVARIKERRAYQASPRASERRGDLQPSADAGRAEGRDAFGDSAPAGPDPATKRQTLESDALLQCRTRASACTR